MRRAAAERGFRQCPTLAVAYGLDMHHPAVANHTKAGGRFKVARAVPVVVAVALRTDTPAAYLNQLVEIGVLGLPDGGIATRSICLYIHKKRN